MVYYAGLAFLIKGRFLAAANKEASKEAARRKRGRAVECTGLENRRGFAPSVSSNLTASASLADAKTVKVVKTEVSHRL